MNMPQVNEWGDQPTNELTRQLIEGKHFFDLDEPGKRKCIVDISYMAAMQLPKGGRNDIPNRLKRHFFPIHVPLPSRTSIEHIYSVLIRCHFSKNNGFDEEVYLAASVLTASAVVIAGSVGFVGLIVPHAIRMLGGRDHLYLVPGAILLGGSFLVFADSLARTILAPQQLPVGVVTALIGVPSFILILRNSATQSP